MGKASDFLGGLFGRRDAATDPTAAAGSTSADAPALGPVEAPGDHGDALQPQGEPPGDAPGDPAAVPSGQPRAPGDVAGDRPDAPDFARWILRPDASGRLGLESPDVPEADRWWVRGDFDDLPQGDACPQCGSLEAWWDPLGGVHCQRCDGAAFERSGRLLELAERLRRRGVPKKSEAAY